jgi:hypothetical protein
MSKHNKMKHFATHSPDKCSVPSHCYDEREREGGGVGESGFIQMHYREIPS